MADTSDLSKEALETAKGLAPWRTSLPWWVVLIEGIVLAVIGVLVLLDPQKANVNVALILTVGLAVAGLLQLWDVIWGRAPESVDSAMAMRAAIAVFAGLVVLLLYFLNALTVQGGLIIVGLASLIYGLLGLVVVFGTIGSQRRTALLETVLFTGIGLLMLYTQFAGAEAVTTALTVAAWLVLVIGVGLIIMAIWRQQKGDEADAAIDAALGRAGATTSASDLPGTEPGEQQTPRP